MQKTHIRSKEIVNFIIDLHQKGYYQHLIIDKLSYTYGLRKISRKTIYRAIKKGSINPHKQAFA